jgi:hypothetical protein
MLARDKSATKPYTIGLTYRVAEVGLICRTKKVLETANRNGVVTDETALPLFPLWIEVFFRNKLGDSKPTDVSSRSCPRRVGGQWGEGLTAAEMAKCRWLKPRLVDDRLSGTDRHESLAAPFGAAKLGFERFPGVSQVMVRETEQVRSVCTSATA